MFFKRWRRFWMRYAGINTFGKFSACMAGAYLPPYYGRVPLSLMNEKGYISPRAAISHSLVSLGKNIYIDDGVLIFQDRAGGPVELKDTVHLHRDTIIQTGQGGSVRIGSETHVQPRCQFSAYKGSIEIGRNVEIAPGCAFYPYDHGMAPGEPVRFQPLRTKGGIVVEDEVWLGVGVTVLDGVRIGKGAVVGAGAVVTKDLPPDSICSGVPARIVKMR